jgi:chromosomal replication initiation ATPase DnaA
MNVEAKSPQLILPLNWRPLFSDDLFVVGESNRLAFECTQKKEWPEKMVCIWGPAHCGKTHLAMLWAKKTNAVFIHHLEQDIQTGKSYIVRMLPSFFQENALLLNLYEALKIKAAQVMWIAHKPPPLWPLNRSDLKSRFLTIAPLEIQLPDDALLSHVLAKIFSDHGIVFSESLIPFMIRRMNRSFAFIYETVCQIHQFTLQNKISIVTIPIIKKIFPDLGEVPLSGFASES